MGQKQSLFFISLFFVKVIKQNKKSIYKIVTNAKKKKTEKQTVKQARKKKIENKLNMKIYSFAVWVGVLILMKESSKFYLISR